MDCPEELILIEKGLRRVNGTGPLAPDYLSRRLRVEFNPRMTDPPTIAAAITQIGFPAQWEAVPQTAAQLRTGGKQLQRLAD
jgi:hypothetical protein